MRCDRKEGTPEGTRRSRPNSLLGLSKPDLPLARPVLDSGDDTGSADINPLYDAINIDSNQPKESDNSMSNNNSLIACGNDLKSIESTNSDNQQTNTNILRPKILAVSEQSSDSTAPSGAFPPGSLTLAFPPDNFKTSTAPISDKRFGSGTQAHARPASWPVQEASEPAQAQRQRRPNSLNLPSRGGSISPSQPFPPSPYDGRGICANRTGYNGGRDTSDSRSGSGERDRSGGGRYRM